MGILYLSEKEKEYLKDLTLKIATSPDGVNPMKYRSKLGKDVAIIDDLQRKQLLIHDGSTYKVPFLVRIQVAIPKKEKIESLCATLFRLLHEIYPKREGAPLTLNELIGTETFNDFLESFEEALNCLQEMGICHINWNIQNKGLSSLFVYERIITFNTFEEAFDQYLDEKQYYKKYYYGDGHKEIRVVMAIADEINTYVQVKGNKTNNSQINGTYQYVFSHGTGEFQLSIPTNIIDEISEKPANQWHLVGSKLRKILKEAFLKNLPQVTGNAFIPDEKPTGRLNDASNIIFISYETSEIKLADFLKNLLLRISGGKIQPFVARRDITSGANPLKVMLEENLKKAKAIIPICSMKSKESSWVWWETATLWAQNNMAFPLFANISPNTFGAPLTLVYQGRDYFIKDELLETLLAACKEFGIYLDQIDLSLEEQKIYNALREEHSNAQEDTALVTQQIKALMDYKIINKTSELHEYSLEFELQNLSKKKFENINVELYFPIQFLLKTDWVYSHLRSSIHNDEPEYLCLSFDFSALSDDAKKLYGRNLLPGKKLKVFGEGGISTLHYKMDNDLFKTVSKYQLRWEVFVNGESQLTESKPLRDLEYF